MNQLNREFEEDDYMCNCGKVFKGHMARTAHMVSCPTCSKPTVDPKSVKVCKCSCHVFEDACSRCDGNINCNPPAIHLPTSHTVEPTPHKSGEVGADELAKALEIIFKTLRDEPIHIGYMMDISEQALDAYRKDQTR